MHLASAAFVLFAAIAGDCLGASTTNLLVNPGAETGSLAPWTVGQGTPLADNGTYDAAIQPHSGKFAFVGGDNGAATLVQHVALIGNQGITKAEIDTGRQRVLVSYWHNAFNQGSSSDTARVTLTFRNADGGFISDVVVPEDNSPGIWTQFRGAFPIPIGTRFIDYTMEFILHAGNACDAFIDDNVLEVGTSFGTGVVSGTFYWTTFGNPDGYGKGSFRWDGINVSASVAQLGALPASGVDRSLQVGNDGNIYSGRAGTMYQIEPATGAFIAVNTGVDNTITSINPTGDKVFVGGPGSAVATLVTGSAFAAGQPHNVSGDDTSASGLAWVGSGPVWYTTGSDSALGNVGKINLSTYTTQRLLTGISATSIVYDPFTQSLFTAGIDGIVQIDPAKGTVLSKWPNPRGTGLFIQNLSVNGKGLLVAFDDNDVRIWDFRQGSRLIGQPDTVTASAHTSLVSPGLVLAPLAVPPVITSPLNARAAQGHDFVYQIEATDARTLNVSALPAGLTFNRTLSAIVGEPSVSGSYQITLQASNFFGATKATLSLTIRPSNAPGPLVISSTSATGRTLQPFRFQVISTGASAAARLTASGLPAGLTLDAITGVISGAARADGSSSVALTLTDDNAIAQSTLQLTFSSDPALPVITSPSAATIAPGQSFSYQIVAPSTLTDRAGTLFNMIGDLPAGLGFDPSSGTISGTTGGPVSRTNRSSIFPPGSGGSNLSGGVITNVQLFATNASGTSTLPLVFYLAPVGVVNISTRLAIDTGDNVLIGGFIIDGNAPKKVIIRATGPSLTQGGAPLPGRLMDPVLQLYAGQTLLGSNDSWRSNQEQEIIDTGIPPLDDREAAAVAILNVPASYTAIARGKASSTGIGLLEVYDLGTASLDTTSNASLVNLSTRGLVQNGDNVLIGGFIVSGQPTKLILRGIGPSLSDSGISGALQDPTLDLVDGYGTVVNTDDNWRTGGQEQEILDTGIPPKDDRESAVVATLNPGGYTAIVRGAGGTTGIGLVELYVLK